MQKSVWNFVPSSQVPALEAEAEALLGKAEAKRTEDEPLNKRKDDRRKTDRRRQGRRRADVAANKRRNMIRSLRASVVYCLLAFFAVVTFVTMGNDGRGNVSWDTFATKWNTFYDAFAKKEDDFKINGMSLGMTPDRIRGLYPSLTVKLDNNGAMKGSYTANDANYTVSFTKQGGSQKAFQIRYDKNFKDMTEEQILQRIGQRFGRPASTNCTRSGLRNSSGCHFRWWLRGNTVLNVYTTVVTDKSGKTRTGLSMVAADSYLEGKINRAQANRLSPPSSPNVPTGPTGPTGQADGKESLPF